MAPSLVSRLWMKLCKKRPCLSIMIVGLDNSGKTSILNNLAAQQPTRAASNQQADASADSKSPSASSLGRKSPPTVGLRSTTKTSICKGQAPDNVTPTVGYNYGRIQHKGLTFTALDFSGQNRYRNLWQEFYNCVDAIVFVIDSSDLIRLVVVRDELETLLSHPYFGTLPGEDGQKVSSSSGNSDEAADRKLTLTAPIFAQKQITVNNQGKLLQSPLVSDVQASVSRAAAAASSINKPQPSRRRLKIPILFLANKSDLANSVDLEVIVRALNLNQLPKSRHPWLIQATSVTQNQGVGEAFDWLAQQLSSTSFVSTASATAVQPATLEPAKVD